MADVAAQESYAPARRSAQLFLLRFGLIAFALYHVPLFLNAYPTLGGGGFKPDGLAVSWGHVFGRVGIAVAQHVFGIDRDLSEGLSGDNGDSVEEFCRLLLAVVVGLIGAAIWVAADRRRRRAPWVPEALRILLRYSIVLGLASYAIAKVYPMQFPPLESTGFEARLGEMPPMRLLWATMQYSRPYALFAGLAELAVVLLLAFRRTSTLGALLCVPVMVNVVLMNWCYGVPVKLFSTMILISALALVAFDARRLLDVLVLHRASPAPPPPPALPRWRWIAKALVVGSVLASSIAAMHDRAPIPHALSGTWIADGPGPWRRLAFASRQSAARLADDKLVRCTATHDDAAHTLKLTCGDHEADLSWTLAGDALQLSGTLDGAPLAAAFHRLDESTLPLLRTEFYWTFD